MSRDQDPQSGLPQEIKTQEGRALKALWDQRRTRPAAISQAEFSREYLELSAGYLPQFFTGLRPLTARIAQKFAEYIGCDVRDFSPRLADEMARQRRMVEWPFDFDPELLEGLSPGELVALSGMIKGWIIDLQAGGKSTKPVMGRSGKKTA